ncbi:hypothetical protein [Actinomycetospora sp. NBRC 106378]|uniref:hypothetical protein n=1 Tax=Actinomycetospora sp. NBRC 106378 TaxID=3032208 RepID=UPI0025561FD0|nr:hypothetical protein [Actinomycetospora sp. NBRC 106378]
MRVTGHALAATTTAAVGGLIGGATGTVVGAAFASVVTTVGEAVYQRSLERTRDHVRSRLDARRRPAPAPTAVLPDGPPADDSPTVHLRPVAAGGSRSRAKIAALVASGLLVFLVAMVVVTGIERVKGSPLSGGTGTSVGEVIGTRPSDDATTTEPPDTTADDPTTTTGPEATTTTRSASRTTTSRSREPAVTTTLEQPAN